MGSLVGMRGMLGDGWHMRSNDDKEKGHAKGKIGDHKSTALHRASFFINLGL